MWAPSNTKTIIVDRRRERHPFTGQDADAALSLVIVQRREQLRLVVDRPDVEEADDILADLPRFRSSVVGSMLMTRFGFAAMMLSTTLRTS